MGICWMMIAGKHTRRPELQGDYLDVVEQYKDKARIQRGAL